MNSSQKNSVLGNPCVGLGADFRLALIVLLSHADCSRTCSLGLLGEEEALARCFPLQHKIAPLGDTQSE